MKTTLFFTLILTGFSAFSANTPKSFSFHFAATNTKTFAITQKAATKEEAFKLAAKECFTKLTGNRYPGEEKGLEIIDICANPKM